MLIRFWKLNSFSLSLASLFLAGCESQPAAGPLPVRIAQTDSVPVQQTAPESASLAPASSSFSLPIGTEIPAEAVPQSEPNSPSAPLSVPFVTPQPPQGQEPQPNPPPATPASSKTGSSPVAQRKSVHLSAGIAVPQSLPIGTVMAISVDYSLSGDLKTSSRYALVVKSGAGESVSEVQLESSGNLSIFFEQLKPEHRPFSARIEEVTPGSKRRTIISNEVTLKTDY